MVELIIEIGSHFIVMIPIHEDPVRRIRVWDGHTGFVGDVMPRKGVDVSSDIRAPDRSPEYYVSCSRTECIYLISAVEMEGLGGGNNDSVGGGSTPREGGGWW